MIIENEKAGTGVLFHADAANRKQTVNIATRGTM
jgi:hypothetical protein